MMALLTQLINNCLDIKLCPHECTGKSLARFTLHVGYKAMLGTIKSKKETAASAVNEIIFM